uniref:Ig-like domain-containing protein n=1 Tax=Bubo bubo TaxID=30461 RepID=A0A8C0FEG7_BUBBB
MTEALASYLELYAVKPTDSGRYTCKVSNVAGSVTCSANLFVKEPTHLVKKGGYAELTCEVTGTPEIKITWFKDDRELKESVCSLCFFFLTVLSNVCITKSGTIMSLSNCFSFLEPPYFVTHLEPLEVSVGDYTTLQCRIAGTPEITVSWYKGDTKLRSTPEYKVFFKDNVATLIFNKVVSNDSGEYICKAENSVGTASTKALLKVQGDDFILAHYKFFFSCKTIKRLLPGEYLSFTCFLLEQPITVTWHKDDKYQATLTDNTCSLKVNRLQESDMGTYLCTASNVAGSDEYSSDSGEYICKVENAVGEAASSSLLTVQGEYFILKNRKMAYFS